jgi:flagellar biogenesis protein FliO
VKARVFFGGLLTASAISLTVASAHADGAETPPPSWLAQPARSAVPLVPPTAPLRSLGLLMLLAIAGGLALVARKRWARPDAIAIHPRLRVLDTVRLADKSHLVLTRVGERCLLLGVTSHSVRRIAWLKFAETPAEQVPVAERAPAMGRGTARDEQVDGSDTDRNGFPGLLRQAFAQDAGNAPASDDSPAALIAAKTKDTVEPFSVRATQARASSSNGSRGRSQAKARAAKGDENEEPFAPLVEAQASGLAARRRR